MKRKQGAMYIDVVITTIITAIAIVAVFGVFTCLYTYSKVNSLADNIADFAAITGQVDGAAFTERYDALLTTYGLSKSNMHISYDSRGGLADNEAAVQYGEYFKVRFEYTYDLKYFGTNSNLSIPISINKIRLSQCYWKTN